MTKRVVIFIFMLLGLFAANSWAQSSQATMDVSVEVVRGTSVEVAQPNIIILSKSDRSSVGTLTMQGMKEGAVFVSNTGDVTLRNGNGDQVEMNIISKTESEGNQTESILYEGFSNNEMVSSIYRGELTTTIEYL